MKYIITKQLQGGMASNPFLAVLSIYDDAGILLLTKRLEYETKPTDTKILNDFKAMKTDILDELGFTGEKEVTL